MEVVPVYTMPFSMVFLMFVLFSFMGWCAEVIYVGIISEHKFVNRGFLYGPLCPIYGFGGIVILLLPQFLYKTWIPLFFASMVLCTAVEYFVSWLLEKLFKTLWWDYSHFKININGRICLLNSILFGLFGVLAVHFVIPYIMLLLVNLGKYIKVIAFIVAILLTIDINFTLAGLVDFSTTMEKLRSFEESLKDAYSNEEWFSKGSLELMLRSIKEKAEKEKNKFSSGLLQKVEDITKEHKSVERMVKKFRTLNSKKYKNSLNFIKHITKEHLKKK